MTTDHAIGVTKSDVKRWAAEEYGEHVFHEQRYLWWRSNVRIGIAVNLVTAVLAAFFWPAILAVVVGTVMILRGIDSMREERRKSDHHLCEHHKWSSIERVW